MDEGRISFTPAVELSYLNEQEQQDLLEQIEQSDCTPSLSQACRFKKISQGEGLTPEVIAEIMEEEKANQKERVKIPTEKLRKYFPKNYTVQQIEDEIIKTAQKHNIPLVVVVTFCDIEEPNEEENWAGEFPKCGGAGCTGICGGMYLLSWLDSELLSAHDREEAFTPVFSGLGLGLAQSWYR